MNEYDIGKAFERIENELIFSMIRNLDRHRAEETKLGYNWEQWQVKQLQALESYKKGNKQQFQSQFNDINQSIDTLIQMARKDGNMSQEQAILEAIKKGYQTKPLRKSTQTTGEFFRLNNRKLEALITATKKDFTKAEHAILRMADDQYRKIIFDAQVYANSGAATYEKAVDMATKDYLSRGINCIEYTNGARHTVADYAYMAIQTACKRAYLTGEGEKRKEWGISTVIMNKRGNPCPKCLPFVGKILIDDVWSGGSKEDGNYPLMSQAIAKGLYHPRCKDSHTTYFEGISTPPDNKFSNKQIRKIEKEVKNDVRKHYINRQIEKYDRLENNALDNDNKKQYKNKINEWKEAKRTLLIEEFNQKHLANTKEELLPEFTKAMISDNKISGYALNKEHPTGKHKAIAFEKYLGYTVDNKDELLNEVYLGIGKYKAKMREKTQHGLPYEVPMIIKGANGKYARIKTGWIIDNGATIPRLTSIYVDE